MQSMLPLLFLTLAQAHTPSPPPPAADDLDAGMIFAGYVLISLIIYASFVVFTWPVMRIRFGWPLFFILLLVVLPPAFLVLLFYIFILRVCFWTALVEVTTPREENVIVVVANPPAQRVMSQRERRESRV
jgi:hypothetical protein